MENKKERKKEMRKTFIPETKNSGLILLIYFTLLALLSKPALHSKALLLLPVAELLLPVAELLLFLFVLVQAGHPVPVQTVASDPSSYFSFRSKLLHRFPMQAIP